jgi:undecaprenyl-diphosphatase
METSMMWWEALILGLIQGLTEFLPVSSSAHLVLGQYLLGMEMTQNLTFEVFVHFGTVLSILTVYRSRLAGVVQEAAHSFYRPRDWTRRYRDSYEFRTIVFILITLIPTGIIYILFEDWIEAAFTSPRFAAGMLFVTATLMFLTLLKRNTRGLITPRRAFVMGIAQSLALIPGISRSGTTICAALYQDVNPQEAADFSFLMLLPVVLGATLVHTVKLTRGAAEFEVLPLLIGTVTAYLAGVLAIKLVIEFVKRGKLYWFAIYLVVVATLGLIFIP